jgi:hypothetical protein
MYAGNCFPAIFILLQIFQENKRILLLKNNTPEGQTKSLTLFHGCFPGRNDLLL